MKPTVLKPHERLPLTCTRAGTCCHGKAIWLNPWELRRLADARGESVAAFQARDTVDGGIRLRMDGPAGWRGLPACSQYDPAQGCTVHPARPLACRLYPLGRQVDGDGVRYLHEGKAFPCRAGCPEVDQLPAMTVKQYLAGQDVRAGELAQDAYRDIVADLGEGAFVVWRDSSLEGDPVVLGHWRQAMADRPGTIGAEFMEVLLAPRLAEDPEDAATWIIAHRRSIEEWTQEAYGLLSERDALIQASTRMFAAALHLAQAAGGDAAGLGKTWLDRARRMG